MIKEIFKELGIKPEQYFLTGSRALDTGELRISSKDSDYDYVLLINYRQNLTCYLKNRNIEIEPSCYNGGFKFKYEGELYNIITPILIEFMAWREALGILKYLINTDEKYQQALKNKLSRYCLYEQLRAILKTSLHLGEFK